MTEQTPPAKSGRIEGAGADARPARDALADLPPMPKVKPAAAKAAKVAKASGGAAGKAAAEEVLGRKELFERVKARTGKVKGHDVRAVMDVLLDEVGAALVKGETLKLPTLGTMKVQRHKPQDKADVVVCKLNRKKPATRAKDPLAKPAEGS